MKPLYILLPLLILLFSCSPSSSDNDNQSEWWAGEKMLRMPVSIELPAELDTRTAPGDPGANEQWQKPDHAYIYVYIEYTGNKTYIITREIELDPSKWVPLDSAENWGTTPYSESIRKYSEYIYIDIPDKPREKGRVYAAVSKGPINNITSQAASAEYYKWDPTIRCHRPTNESDILNIRYACYGTTRTYMRDLYSTPYNLGADGTVKSATNQYYGTIKDLNTNKPWCNVVMYHVGARVDVIWNVDPTVQSSVKISHFDLRWNMKQPCYLFKPVENTNPTSGSDKWDWKIIDDKYGDPDMVATQWYGRAVTYVPAYYVTQKSNPFTDHGGWDASKTADLTTHRYMYLPFRIMNNHKLVDGWGWAREPNDGDWIYLDDGVTHKIVESKNSMYGYKFHQWVELDSRIFTPWIRGTINITTAITNGDHVPDDNKAN